MRLAWTGEWRVSGLSRLISAVGCRMDVAWNADKVRIFKGVNVNAVEFGFGFGLAFVLCLRWLSAWLLARAMSALLGRFSQGSLALAARSEQRSASNQQWEAAL